MGDAQNDERRRYLKRALEHAQQELDSYVGDDNGKADRSRQVQHLWNAYAGAGGNWRDLKHVVQARVKAATAEAVQDLVGNAPLRRRK
jgi:hypothetical protein